MSASYFMPVCQKEKTVWFFGVFFFFLSIPAFLHGEGTCGVSVLLIHVHREAYKKSHLFIIAGKPGEVS